jgi:hypothetical protein
MLNLKRRGCFAAFNRNYSGYNFDIFFLFVDSVSLDTNACAQKPNESIYRAISQNQHRELSVYYKGRTKKFENWMAKHLHSSTLEKLYGIYHYIGLTTGGWKQPFSFGKLLYRKRQLVFFNDEDYVFL